VDAKMDICLKSWRVENLFSVKSLTEALLPGVAASTQGPSAAVAAVMREGDLGVEMLFIERARKVGDPWSGQMAFPGGRTSRDDAHTLATAQRETSEELGLELPNANALGRLSDVEGGPRGTAEKLRVTPHIFLITGPRPELVPNYEVASALWVPVVALLDSNRYVEYSYPPLGSNLWPGIKVEGDRVIWGLTLRMLGDLFERAGKPLTIRP
tara:strand:+ start:145 stop:780 length:636 start_codon:yes stop_codon:yes gene_type:complete